MLLNVIYSTFLFTDKNSKLIALDAAITGSIFNSYHKNMFSRKVFRRGLNLVVGPAIRHNQTFLG